MGTAYIHNPDIFTIAELKPGSQPPSGQPDIFAIAGVAKSDQNPGASLSRVVKVGDLILLRYTELHPRCPIGVDSPDIFAITEETAEMVSWILHDDEEVTWDRTVECLCPF
ncbi:hypothetical protein PENNAL_c0120G11699 [Penicillium nalgiovense]|uniref:Uncharacterized protein n=1 Tax=Penicillium nalgiovense TaxID=60175 RepID=A0A1V6X4Y9_PENNA|nr:hypothetical protein PENNAL_c0120G11699 [Penicillium nalgiovense]